jgi:hypothetical protein
MRGVEGLSALLASINGAIPYGRALMPSRCSIAYPPPNSPNKQRILEGVEESKQLNFNGYQMYISFDADPPIHAS